MVTTKQLAYLSVGIGFLGTIGSFTMGGVFSMIGGLVAGVGALFAILFLKYGYVVMPILTQKMGRSVGLEADYEIPPSQDVVIKKKNGLFYASAFLGIKIYESALEKTQEENIVFSEYFERAISNLKFVAKISMMVYAEDIEEKRKIMETKKAESQLRLSREREKPEPDVLKIDRYEREVAMWEAQLDRLVKGMRPMGLVAYAMTTSTGITSEGAIASVRAQARELKTVLANSLNVDVEFLTADEMLKCFEWERMLPPTSEKLDEEMV